MENKGLVLQCQCILVLKHLGSVSSSRYQNQGIKIGIVANLESGLVRSPHLLFQHPTSSFLIHPGPKERLNVLTSGSASRLFFRLAASKHNTAARTSYTRQKHLKDVLLFFASIHCVAASHNPECASHGCICRSQFFFRFISLHLINVTVRGAMNFSFRIVGEKKNKNIPRL